MSDTKGHTEYMAEWRDKNREKYNTYQRNWRQNHPKKYTQTLEQKLHENEARRLKRKQGLIITSLASTTAWKKRNPHKNNAHRRVNRAIKSGKLTRSDHCEKCGVICKTHAHHENYSEPLIVRWLCPLCHKIEHNLSLTKAGSGG